MLLGLRGLCGAAINLTTPIPAPTNYCGTAEIKPGLNVPYSCCPSKLDIDPKDIPYYKFPPVSSSEFVQPLMRWTKDTWLSNLAMTRMKELDVKDPSDPRGFKQQVNIHCAYCNGAYKVGGKELQLFFGKPYTVETGPKPGQGVVENIPHTPAHIWVGTVVGSDLGNKKSDGEDMGNFYTSGLDPAFYCHHANIDRMWTIWNTLGGKRKDIDETDFLNAEFFFDENKKPVRVTVRDALDNRKMVFDYPSMPIPWRSYKLLKKSKSKANARLIPPTTQRNHSEPHIATIKQFQLAINELLEEIGLEDEDSIVVTLVLKIGGESVTIESAEITLEAC
ncbi:hypothetical protein RND71_042605 [Anisodus tanguticus]|uniref:catechol oxidase n=1 Tax=Anisodus tanguticus TaxID=243964 RepID=A0AAE1QSQ1_9SOLA|nr:hypothetical protein RND71_042605 [Anisodus tanguticus]